jgi:hypothetical protein
LRQAVPGSLTVTRSFPHSSSNANVNFGGVLDLSGSVAFRGGVLTMNGGAVELASTFDISSGATLVGAGAIDVRVDNNGNIFLGWPHSRGTLDAIENDTQGSSGTLNVTLDGQNLTVADQLMVEGGPDLAGMLNVTLASGYTPASGDVFELLPYANRSGTFATINLSTHPVGWLAVYYDELLYPDFLMFWPTPGD